MDAAATLLIDRWLHDDAYGVEVLLPDVPRLTPEGVQNPLPEMPVIVNDCEDESVADTINPDARISLVVFAEKGGEIVLDSGQNNRQFGEGIQIAIVYVTRDVPVLQARRDCPIILRAVVRSLTHFNSLRKAGNARNLNGYHIAQIASIRRWTVATAVGDAKLWGFVVATVEMIDSEPM